MTRAGEPRASRTSADNAPGLHLLIPTHTTRHLAACLASIAGQEDVPDSVVVSCDTDASAIGGLLDEWWPRIGARIRERGRTVPRLLQTFRAHQGGARLNQVRNNGLRALDGAGMLRDEDVVVVIDGDMVLETTSLRRHREQRAAGVEVVIPYRINLEESEAVAPEALLDSLGEREVLQLAAARCAESLRRRERRYRRQLSMRRCVPWLIKPHKPKILGGHHAVSVRVLRALNGYDEGYVGYGYDDDDVSRRVYSMTPRPRVAIAVDSILAFHLWHPTRAPARPTDAPGYARFQRRDLPVYAERGWKNSADQPSPGVRVISNGG